MRDKEAIKDGIKTNLFLGGWIGLMMVLSYFFHDSISKPNPNSRQEEYKEIYKMKMEQRRKQQNKAINDNDVFAKKINSDKIQIDLTSCKEKIK